MSNLTTRKILNPILTIATLICAFTGILLFFHIKTITIMQLHEILGIVMLIALIWHLILNKIPLLHTCGGKICMGILIISTMAIGSLPFMQERLTKPAKVSQISTQHPEQTEQNTISKSFKHTTQIIEQSGQTLIETDHNK